MGKGERETGMRKRMRTRQGKGEEREVERNEEWERKEKGKEW